MNRLNTITILVVSILMPASISWGFQEAPAAQEKKSAIDQAWEKMAKTEPDCTEAILFFAKRPDESIAYFKQKMKAFRLDEETFQKLVKELGSEDETTAKAAYEEFLLRDPRLFMGLQEIMDLVEDTPAQTRMVEVLTSSGFDSMADQEIRLRQTGGGDEVSYNFVSGGSSFWAEAQVKRLGTYVRKPGWARAIRAIKILEDNGSPAALAILARMAQGHPEAQPTMIAKEIALRMKLEKAKKN